MPWPQESEGFIETLTKPVVYYDGYVVVLLVIALMGIDCSMCGVYSRVSNNGENKSSSLGPITSKTGSITARRPNLLR